MILFMGLELGALLIMYFYGFHCGRELEKKTSRGGESKAILGD
jgi:hypothetical protein